jgi:hypothetical protein
MTSEDITPTEMQLPIPTTPNPFEEEGKKAERHIVGQLMKFTKFGTFAAGQDNIELPMGTRFLINTDQLRKGWIRWEGGRPVDQSIMGLVLDGYVPPKRDVLGYGYKPGDKEIDADTSEWEQIGGKPRDPWQQTYYVIMREIGANGKLIEGDEGLYTFSAQSKGGSDAVVVFCQAFGKWFRLKPDDFPIVRLGWDQYEHSEFGWIKTPQFVRGFITAEDARAKRKQQLFEPNLPDSWLPKPLFGSFGEGTTAEEIPF